MNAMPSSYFEAKSRMHHTAASAAPFSLNKPQAQSPRSGTGAARALRPSQRAETISKEPLSRKAHGHPTATGPAPVGAEELQSAVLLVLGLYASMALVNAGTEWSTLVNYWQNFLEFLVMNFLVS